MSEGSLFDLNSFNHTPPYCLFDIKLYGELLLHIGQMGDNNNQIKYYHSY
jgi:hypothetical protein